MLPLHEPFVVVSVWPCCAVPLTVGDDVLAGAVGVGGGGSVPPVLMTSSGALPPSRVVKITSAGVLGVASRKARVPAVTAAVTSI